MEIQAFIDDIHDVLGLYVCRDLIDFRGAQGFDEIVVQQGDYRLVVIISLIFFAFGMAFQFAQQIDERGDCCFLGWIPHGDIDFLNIRWDGMEGRD